MSHVLGGAGVVLAAGSGAAAILLPPGRPRAAALLAALALFPLLILADQWHSHQIVDLRDHPARLAALGLAALAASALLAAAFRRRPIALPLAIVAALPFRIPLEAGGQTANLLVPLYVVIAGGVLASTIGDWRSWPAGPVAAGDPPPARGAVWLPGALAAAVVLYAVQTLYSPDFSKSLQDVCFFLVPFSLVYALLRDVRWDRRLLTLALWVIAIEAVAFVAVGSVEYLSRSLFWNHQVIRSNEFHTYFRVNSVFWDPNVYGRWLALAIVVAMAPLLWARERRAATLLATLVAVLWIGLAPTFSQSSFVALLAGLAVLAGLRWSLRWALGGIAALAVGAVLVVLLAGGAPRISFSRVNIDTSGRANLVSGGLRLFAQRPLWGFGSGSFPKAYREHVRTRRAPVSISHTEPVTVAAEQGLIGLAAYAALILTALWTMAAGLFDSRAGGRANGLSDGGGVSKGGSGGGGTSCTFSRPPIVGSQRRRSKKLSGTPTRSPSAPTGLVVGRTAILAAFVALLVHTLAYAGFFEDPIAWVLLAAGASLAAAPPRAAALGTCR